MKKITTAFLVLLLLAVAVVALSPYFRLYQLKNAYEAGEYKKVVLAVDFEAVRPKMKAELSTRLDTTLTQNKEVAALSKLFPEPFEALNKKAHSELNQAVDEALTADNVEALLMGDISPKSKKLAGMWAVASDYVDYQVLLKDILTKGVDSAIANQQNHIKAQVIKKTAPNTNNEGIQMRYCGFDCFYVKSQFAGQPVGAYLYRQNLIDWQIKEIILP